MYASVSSLKEGSENESAVVQNGIATFRNIKQRLKEIIDMRDWLAFLGLTPYKGFSYYLCPFHQERNPSFSATRTVATDWHDQTTYDIFSIAQALKKWSFKETFQQALHFAGIDISVYKKLFMEQPENDPIKALILKAKRDFRENKESILQAFSDLKGYMLPESVQDQALYFPVASKHPLSGRLCFEWKNFQGATVGLVGRSLSPSARVKYMYSSVLETEKFSKSCFFNIHKNKKAETIIVTEGILDALVGTACGGNVVACGGVLPPPARFFADLLDVEETSLKSVIFLPDPDEKGLEAFVKGMSRFLDQFSRYDSPRVELFGCLLECDLDEFLMKKGGTIQQVIDSAIPLEKFLLDLASTESTSSVKQHVFKVLCSDVASYSLERRDPLIQAITNSTVSLEEILKTIHAIQLQSEREKYINFLCRIRKLRKTAVLSDLKKIAKQAEEATTAEKPPEEDPILTILHEQTKRPLHTGIHIDPDITSVGFSAEILKDNVHKRINFIVYNAAGKIHMFSELNKNGNRIFVSPNGSDSLVENGTGENIQVSTELQYIPVWKKGVLPYIEERWSLEELKKMIDPSSHDLHVKNSLTSTFYELVNVISTYVDIETSGVKLLATYVILTYFYRIFDAIPYLFVYGPKGSGKSHLLDIMAALCFHALKYKTITLAALTDVLDISGGTLIIDQAESLGLSTSINLDLVGLLADGYTRFGARRCIVTVERGKRKTLEFETFGPKIFGSIREINEDIRDRCILVSMTRTLTAIPRPDFQDEIWKKLRSELLRSLLLQGSSFCSLIRSFASKIKVRNRLDQLIMPLLILLEIIGVDEATKEQVYNYAMVNTRLMQAELPEEDEKFLLALIRKGESTFGTLVLSKKQIKQMIEDLDIKKEHPLRWGLSKLKQYSLVNRIIERQEDIEIIHEYEINVEEAKRKYSIYSKFLNHS